MTTRIVWKVRAARITVSSSAPIGRTRGRAGSWARSTDAEGALGTLPGGVGADRWPGHRHARRVDDHLLAADRDDPVVEAAWCRAAALLAYPVVLGAVARAL